MTLAVLFIRKLILPLIALMVIEADYWNTSR